MWVHFCSIDIWVCFCVSIIMFCYYIALQYTLKSGSVIPPVLFFKILLAIWDLLWFHANFRMISSSSVKNTIGILIRITLNLQIVLGGVVILTVLILPIREHCISFHLFVLYLIYFTSVFDFSRYRSFTILNLFPRISFFLM